VLGFGVWQTLPREAEDPTFHPQLQAAYALLVADGQGGATFGDLTQDLGSLARADALIADVLEKHPNSAEAHLHRGLYFIALREGAEAQASLERSAELAPEAAEPRLLLGGLHYTRGDYAAAEREFRRAVELAPDSDIARHNLGQTLWMLGREQEALEVYREKLSVRQSPSLQIL
ncbi:MAG: tetratricopeptide repeat protein, partial [Acidobacteriota bacterium]